MTDRTPTGDLRERLADALHRHTLATGLPTPFPPDLPEDPWLERARQADAARADAVLPVVEAAITRARAACCEDGDRTYAEMERHLTRRAEEAEKQRDAAHRMLERIPDVHMRFGVVGVVEPEDAACADWCYACRLERAETAVQRVRDLADAADADVSGSFARRFGGEPFPAKVPTEVLRAALDAKQPTGQPALTEVVTEEATRLAATATSGVDATEVTVNLDAEQTEAAPRPDDTCQAMPDLYPTLGKESL